mmetsp:Transcript_8021/g.18312  ORF Transcript_8021/g.18312 Transcript_8021/m.18312 type:complete len:326 (-) Transcript_8021:14-991(-)|eukprot:752393-Hanusia_phi.AAC.5
MQEHNNVMVDITSEVATKVKNEDICRLLRSNFTEEIFERLSACDRSPQDSEDDENTPSKQDDMGKRQVKPASSKRQQLTAEEACEIYMLRPTLNKDGSMRRGSMLHCKSVAPKYGVTPKTIRDVWSGRSWAEATKHLWTPEEVKRRRTLPYDPFQDKDDSLQTFFRSPIQEPLQKDKSSNLWQDFSSSITGRSRETSPVASALEAASMQAVSGVSSPILQPVMQQQVMKQFQQQAERSCSPPVLPSMFPAMNPTVVQSLLNVLQMQSLQQTAVQLKSPLFNFVGTSAPSKLAGVQEGLPLTPSCLAGVTHIQPCSPIPAISVKYQ